MQALQNKEYSDIRNNYDNSILKPCTMCI